MNDIRLALRVLRATPIVTSVAILSLALGIGANTAIFSLVNSVALRSVPVRDPERLVLVSDASASDAGAVVRSYPMWEQIRDRPQLFDGSLAYFSTRFNLASAGQTDFVVGLWASGRFFEVLGVTPILGRTFSEVDEQPFADPSRAVVVVSHAFWQKRLGGASDAIGRTLTIERLPFTIIGVLPPGFSGLVVGRTADVIIPFGAAPLLRGRTPQLDDKITRWVTVMARLKPTQTIQSATQLLRGVQPQIRDASFPTGLPARMVADYLKSPLTLVPAGAGNRFSPMRLRYEQPLWTLLVVVALVLFVACTNIANLMLARAVARRHEMSVRSALGASRWRLIRQLLVETGVLAAIGAIGGFVLAQLGSRFLVALLSNQSLTYPLFLNLTPDMRVLGFTIGVGAMAALLFGTAPALRAARAQPIEALNDRGRGVDGRHSGLANGFVVAQVSLSLVLVVGASLFVRTYTNLTHAELGFDPSGVLVASVDAANPLIPPSNRQAVLEEVRRAVSRLAETQGAAFGNITPLDGSLSAMQVDVPGAALARGARQTSVNSVGPGWLSIYRTPMLAGRDFVDADGRGPRRVVIVNRAFAKKFLNAANPIGVVVRQAEPPPGQVPVEWEVVGMVGDAVYNSLRVPAPPTLYRLFGEPNLYGPQVTAALANLSIRTRSAAPMAHARDVAGAIVSVNPNLSVTIRPLSDFVGTSVSQERLLAILSAFFGALALLLAAVGLYGVTSYTVSRRYGEIGIRLTLGAAPTDVIGMVLSRISTLVCLGIALGAGLAWWMARFVAPALLYDVPARDPLTIAGASIILATVGALAAWLPARRAARIDPAQVLREA
jgi:putative ABC transport system permease protein